MSVQSIRIENYFGASFEEELIFYEAMSESALDASAQNFPLNMVLSGTSNDEIGIVFGCLMLIVSLEAMVDTESYQIERHERISVQIGYEVDPGRVTHLEYYRRLMPGLSRDQFFDPKDWFLISSRSEAEVTLKTLGILNDVDRARIMEAKSNGPPDIYSREMLLQYVFEDMLSLHQSQGMNVGQEVTQSNDAIPKKCTLREDEPQTIEWYISAISKLGTVFLISRSCAPLNALPELCLSTNDPHTALIALNERYPVFSRDPHGLMHNMRAVVESWKQVYQGHALASLQHLRLHQGQVELEFQDCASPIRLAEDDVRILCFIAFLYCAQPRCSTLLLNMIGPLHPDRQDLFYREIKLICARYKTQLIVHDHHPVQLDLMLSDRSDSRYGLLDHSPNLGKKIEFSNRDKYGRIAYIEHDGEAFRIHCNREALYRRYQANQRDLFKLLEREKEPDDKGRDEISDEEWLMAGPSGRKPA